MKHLDNIDRQAEREAMALKRQGYSRSHSYKRIRQQKEYNQEKFKKLFAY